MAKQTFWRDDKKFAKGYDAIDWGTPKPVDKKKKSTKDQVNIVIKVN